MAKKTKRAKRAKTKVSVPKVMKRGPGRPRKERKEVEEVSAKTNVMQSDGIKVEKRRGRPPKYPRNLGTETDMSKVKICKFVGFCPECRGMLVTTDLLYPDPSTKRNTYTCGKCNHKGGMRDIMLSLNVDDKPKSKKEFLEQTLVVNEEWVLKDYPAEVPEEFVVPDPELDV